VCWTRSTGPDAKHYPTDSDHPTCATLTDLMGTANTLDLMARDHRSGSVLLATAIGPADAPLKLRGSLYAVAEPGSIEAIDLPVEAAITADGINELSATYSGDSVYYLDAASERVGAVISSYGVVPSIDGRYEIHSGVVVDADGEADVVAVSDPAELILAGIVATACLAIYGGQIYILKETIAAYRERGLVPKLTMRSGFRQALTCQFDLTITALDPSGRVVEIEQIRIGRGGKDS
jgi:hypothetical protein